MSLQYYKIHPFVEFPIDIDPALRWGTNNIWKYRDAH